MKNGLMAKVMVLAVILTTIGIAGTEEKLGDITDGSRAMPIHLIPLLAEPLPDKEPDQIYPGDVPLLPFSTKQTCGACHSYDIIATGWHFNAIDPNVAPGRRGQAWILADPAAATQIPLSYRAWPGTFRPEQLGITPIGFLQLFGRQLPGGGIGEMLDKTDNPEETLSLDITGQLEINCLACHNLSPAQDMGSAAGYAWQVMRGNYRWAATASSEFAYVTGTTKGLTNYDFRTPFVSSDTKLRPPAVEYRKESFGHNDWIRFDVSRDIPKQRCYFCHSNIDIRDGKTEPWKADEDVHIGAGLKCVNCHSHGLQHNITRGYASETRDSNNPLTPVSSCEGCHLGKGSVTPVAGRFAAPVPKHPGIPPTHLDKLSCTACHSGPWPSTETVRAKTARAHAIGVAGANPSGDVLPHLAYPVYAKGQDGKITPHKIFWPAYWAAMTGDAVTPLNLDTVRSATTKVITKAALSKFGDWPDLKEDDVAKILSLLVSSVPAEAKPIYIAGGNLYSLNEAGGLNSAQHKLAEPYMWPIAHDVRPAAQSLGVRRCEDCHSPETPFFFGKVWIDSPVEGKGGFREMKDMYEFAGPVYVRVNLFFKLLIIGVMALLILHILGDLYRRVMLRLFKRGG